MTELTQFTFDERDTDYSEVIQVLRETSEQIQNRMDYSDHALKFGGEPKLDKSEYPDQMRQADTLWESARYLEFVGKYGRLHDVVWFSEHARNLERKSGANPYRGEIKPYPTLLTALQLLIKELSTIDEEIYKQSGVIQVVEWHKSTADPELLSRRKTFAKAICALRKINYHNTEKRG